MKKQINLLVGFMIIISMLTAVAGAGGSAVSSIKTALKPEVQVVEKIIYVEKIIKVPQHVKVPVFVELVKPATVSEVPTLATAVQLHKVKTISIANNTEYKERIVCQIIDGVKHFSNEFMAIQTV